MLTKIGFEEVSRIGIEEYLGRIDQLIQYHLKVYKQIAVLLLSVFIR